MRLEFETVRHDLSGEPEERRLGDGTNGLLHLLRLRAAPARGDLVLRSGDVARLHAGILPDGRRLAVQVRAFDVRGRLVAGPLELRLAGGDVTEIALTGLARRPAGVYFVEVRGSRLRAHRRVVLLGPGPR